MKQIYELDVYKLAEELSDKPWYDFDKETKSWLRKLIRRKVLSELDEMEYKVIIDKLGPKLNTFINSTKA
ncbi:MAG: hypothetical protein AB1567_13440 [bacterium]